MKTLKPLPPPVSKKVNCPACQKPQVVPAGQEKSLRFRCRDCHSAMWLKKPSEGLSKPAQEKRAILEPETVSAPVKRAVTLSTYDIPAGQVRRQVGDVFLWSHVEYVVESVGSCSAMAKCADGKKISVSTCADKGSIIRHIENFQPHMSGAVVSGKLKTSDEQENNNMKTKETKKNNEGGNPMEFVLALAKRGNTEKEITSAYKANYGVPSAHMVYVIGREWRRNNKAAVKPAKRSAKPAAKLPAPKKGKPAPTKKSKAVKTAAPLPPPPPKPAAVETEEPAAGE